MQPEDLADTRAYVKSVAMKYVRDEADADDVTQDALLLAHRYRDSFRGESRYSTWLYRVTATAALMFLRRQRRLCAGDPRERNARRRRCAAASNQQPARTDLRGEVIARTELGHVQEAVAALGAKYPAVFWKRYGEGRTETEICARARNLRRGRQDSRVSWPPGGAARGRALSSKLRASTA